MSKRLPKLLVIDMLDCLEKIEDYTEGLSYETFLSDTKTQDAVIRNIQVIGEAANRIPDAFRKNYPDIEWTKLIRSRHIITHEYDIVDNAIVWKIVTIYVPSLKSSLEKILKEL